MAPPRKSKPRNTELAALGKAIETRMAELGMSQPMLEQASGIDIRRLGDYIRGHRNPNLPNLKRLCKGLRLTVDQLMSRAAEEEARIEPQYTPPSLR